MGLIIEDVLRSDVGVFPPNAVKVYLRVLKKYLSDPYDLTSDKIIFTVSAGKIKPSELGFPIVIGEILDILSVDL